MKWFLGVAGVTGALFVAGFFVPVGQSQPVAKADPAAKATRTLTASGSGTVKAAADAARITLKIEASGADMKAARKALDAQTKKLKDALEGLKLGVEIRPLPIEIARQDNGFGFGGGGFAPPGVPMEVPPPMIEFDPDMPVFPPVPAPAPPVIDNFISAPLPDRAIAPAPDRAPVPPANDPAVAPQPPVGGADGGFGQPLNGNAGFQLTQGFVVTIKNNDAAKLIDGVNNLLLAAADAGVQLPGANNNNPFGPAGGFGGGGIGVGGGFPLQGNVHNQSGPRVVLFRADEKEARRKALELAVADAMANAKAMAKGGDVKIIDTISISDPPATGTGQPVFDGTMGVGADTTTGEMEITVKVTVTCSY